MTMSLAACGPLPGPPPLKVLPDENNASSGVEDGVLIGSYECAYAPYNWTQNDDSNGAVPLPTCLVPMPTAMM